MTEETTGNIAQKSFLAQHWQLILNVILLAAVAAVVIYFSLARPKIGYVDSTALLNRTAVGQSARTALQAQIEEYQSDILKREQEIQVLYNLLEKTSQPDDIQRELEEKVKSYEEYVQQVNTELSQKESEMLQPVYEKINAAVQDYGARHGYYIIMGATSSGNVVYGSPQADITEDLIKYVDTAVESQAPEKAEQE